MKGNWIFLGLACFFGVLSSFEKGLFLFPIILLYIVFLRYFRKFSKNFLLLIISAFLLFFVKAEVDEKMNKTTLTGKEREFSLKLLPPYKVDGNYFSAYGVDVRTKEKIVVGYRIPTLDEKNKLSRLQVGTICKVKGKLEAPKEPRNANAFNYKEYLRHENIHWTMSIEGLNLDECKQERSLYADILNVRQIGIHYIYSQFPEDTAPLAAALIFGDRNIMEPDLMLAYQRLGIVHLLAISGLNVGMLIGIIFYIGLRLNVTREKMTYLLLGFLPVYMILTGGTPSVIRACLMVMLALLLARFYQTKLIPIDILSIVFLLYLFFQPNVIYDVGFQLSFVVTCSLVLSSSILSRYTQRPISFLIATSLVSQLASMPVLLYHFYEFSIVSVFVNILYVPLFSAILSPLLLGLYVLHIPFGELLSPLLSLVDLCLHYVNRLTLFLSDFPLNTLVLGRPSRMIILSYCIGIPLTFYKWEQARSTKQLVMALQIPLFLLAFHYMTEKIHIEGEVTVLDVGQGDSILIRLPLNKGTYLIDTGGVLTFPSEDWEKRSNPFEVGKDIVVPFLKSEGITTLDKLILTHGDMDHVGGAKEVLKSLKVKEVVLPQVKEQSSQIEELILLCKQKRIAIHYGSTGDSWSVSGGYVFTILSPNEGDIMERNDQSIVLHTKLGGKSWLFTGDLESEGETRLLARYPKLSVDVLKVGHHGSNTSTTEPFLDNLRPKVALISAGVDNRFGHPRSEVLQRLEARKVRVYRTDEHGAISFKFRRENGTFYTELHSIKQ